MIEHLNMRTDAKEWRKDLEMGLGNAGIYPLESIRACLYRNLNGLKVMVDEFDGLMATIITPKKDDKFWAGIKVSSHDGTHPFFAYVNYGIDNQNKLFAEIYCTERPSTAEFPVESGAVWRTHYLNESEVRDSRFVVANVKNDFIKYESFKRIGRDIIYAIMEE